MIAVVLQARMGSTRLPGKVLMELAGRPMLAWACDRLAAAGVGPVILATSDGPADDAVAAFAERRGLAAFRGSEADVLDRYHRCAQAHGLDWVVRATGDNPFVDPEECARLVAFAREGSFDYAESVTAGLPTGIGLEIFSAAALARSWAEGHAAHHREHVNEYILENPGLFRCGTLMVPEAKRAPELSFTVDTPADFAAAGQALTEFAAQRPDGVVSTEWLIARARRG